MTTIYKESSKKKNYKQRHSLSYKAVL